MLSSCIRALVRVVSLYRTPRKKTDALAKN